MNEPRRDHGERAATNLAAWFARFVGAAQTSRAGTPESPAEQYADHLINGMLASEDRRL
jgi:hypothetical protein